jgi:hypothetical protein
VPGGLDAGLDFIGEHSGAAAVRGGGEPIWADRTPAQLVECQGHEDLLNRAFQRSGRFAVLCPHGVSSLGPEVLSEALRSHPFVFANGQGGQPDGPYPEEDGVKVGGYGLWMANQLCDLGQIRSKRTGSVVRRHLAGASCRCRPWCTSAR